MFTAHILRAHARCGDLPSTPPDAPDRGEHLCPGVVVLTVARGCATLKPGIRRVGGQSRQCRPYASRHLHRGQGRGGACHRCSPGRRPPSRRPAHCSHSPTPLQAARPVRTLLPAHRAGRGDRHGAARAASLRPGGHRARGRGRRRHAGRPDHAGPAPLVGPGRRGRGGGAERADPAGGRVDGPASGADFQKTPARGEQHGPRLCNGQTTANVRQPPGLASMVQPSIPSYISPAPARRTRPQGRVQGPRRFGRGAR